ncbi:MAG: cyclase family protein [Candidatus Binatia bacterium]
MKKRLFLILCLFLYVFPAHAADEKNLIDLTYSFDETTMHWPTAKPFKLDKVNQGKTPQGFWYASYEYSASEHVGTHLDAPFHFAEGKWTTEQIPLHKLIGPAVIIDVRAQSAKNPDYLLEVKDITAWEKKNGGIPSGALVLMHSGWGKFWGDRKKYFGTDAPGDVTNLHFPGYSKEAAEFLVKRRINGAGLDTPSIDYGQSRDFIVHQIFGAANIAVFENVANLERLPPKGATLYAIPMKIKGGTGGPLRIFAVLP